MRFRLQTVVDLVCGMRMDENTSQFKSKVNGISVVQAVKQYLLRIHQSIN